MNDDKSIPRTYKELHSILVKLKSFDERLEWLGKKWMSISSSTDKQKFSSYNKQEAVFRLLSLYGLHSFQTKDFKVCKGTFNNGTVKKCTKKDIHTLYTDGSIKDSGDKSDATFLNSDETVIICITSKDYSVKNEQVGKLDVGDISFIANQHYKQKDLIIGFCVHSKEVTHSKMLKSHVSSELYKSALKKAFDTNMVFDHDYLANLLAFLPTTEPEYNKTEFIPYFHQELCYYKIKEVFKRNDVAVLNALPRSGKTQICGLCIKRLPDLLNNADVKNVLLITLRPSENLSGYKEFFNTFSGDLFNSIYLNDNKDKKPVLKKTNIIICSKQYLQHKNDSVRKIKWLSELHIDLSIIDESHDGGSTDLAKSVYEMYGKNSKTLFVTATCGKTVIKYNIPRENIIKWDLEDVTMCKNFSDTTHQFIVEKHGEVAESVLANFSERCIRDTYSKFPTLILSSCGFFNEIKQDIVNANKGWSINALLNLDSNGNFENEKEVIKFLQSIFGEQKGTSNIAIQDTKCKMYEWRQIVLNAKHRIQQSEPEVILVFIDHITVTKLGKALKSTMTKVIDTDEYDIIVLNTEENKGQTALQRIENAQSKARNSGKLGVIAITGQMCSTAVTIPKCDIVMLLDNGKSWDNYYQKVFRPMTQDEDKTCAIVYDCNNRRSLSFVAVLSEHIYGKSDVESINKILSNNMVKIKHSYWYNSDNKVFQTQPISSLKMAQIIHKEWLRDVGATKMIIKALSMNSNVCSDTITYFKNMFKNISSKKKGNTEPVHIFEDIPVELQGMDTDISDGLTKENTRHTVNKELKEDNEHIQDLVEKDFNLFQEVFRYLVVVMLILSLDNDSNDNFSDMCLNINRDYEKKKMVLQLLQSIWGNRITEDVLMFFRDTYDTELVSNFTLSENIRYLKERFISVKNSPYKLYQIIEEFLIPHETERKNNAEISTPQQLRKEMLDKLPTHIWSKRIRVFEPCCGKGGFLIDIVSRFMVGLKNIIPGQKRRRKFILEKMLYFADINPINIYICSMILDPERQYKLNCYTGDTLKLDIKQEWGIDKFKLIVGNPPYNSSGSTATGNTIWQHFTRKSLEEWLIHSGFLCFVHPPGWRKPNTEKGKFYGMFELMTQRTQLLYLSIHGIKDGQQTFHCGTRYDWYVIKKTPNYKSSVVRDEKGKLNRVNMSDFNWLPNYNIKTIHKLLAKEGEETCPIIYNRSNYGADKKWMSKVETDEFKHPCIHSTPKSGIRYMYSKFNDKGHFGVQKVIFGDSGIYNPIIDIEGVYGMTQHAMAIEVKNKVDANELSNILTTDKMKLLIDSCLFSSYAIDWNIFKDFKRDFWKLFPTE